jgi:phosphoribosylglycinamide formyltransferase-1
MSGRTNDSTGGSAITVTQLKLAVLISGSGTNLQALIDACADVEYPAEISLVISNKDGAGGLERAERAGIPTLVIRHTDFASRDDFDNALTTALEEAKADLVCLAGFMRVLERNFVEYWRDRLINIHPALLPAFKGLHTHKRALEAGVRIAGCTVHFVRAEVDVGPIIAQAAVPVLPDDTEESLARRVLEQEHRIYPIAIELIARGQVTVEGVTAQLRGQPETQWAALVNPQPRKK